MNQIKIYSAMGNYSEKLAIEDRRISWKNVNSPVIHELLQIRFQTVSK